MSVLKSPFQLRHESLNELKTWFNHFFKAFPQFNSALLFVAQYWDDNAYDAVHPLIVGSKQSVAESIAQAAEMPVENNQKYFPWHYRERVGVFPWNDDSDAIRPFQALCAEGSSQNIDYASCFLPAYCFGRNSQAVFVGEAVRPWLDFPRAAPRDGTVDTQLLEVQPAVESLSNKDRAHFDACIPKSNRQLGAQLWADALVSQSDPRGQFMALCQSESHEPAVENEKASLLAQHGESWLEDLIHVCALSTVQWKYGLPDAVTLHVEPEYSWALDCHVLQTVEKIHFSLGSTICFSDAMCCATEITGLTSASQVSQCKFSNQIEHLGFVLNSVTHLQSLSPLGELTLVLSPAFPRLELALQVLLIPNVNKLNICFMEPMGEGSPAETDLPTLNLVWDLPIERISIGGSSPNGKPAGPTLRFQKKNPFVIELKNEGLATVQGQAFEKQLLSQLPLGVKTVARVK
jgi:hypothetical protein